MTVGMQVVIAMTETDGAGLETATPRLELLATAGLVPFTIGAGTLDGTWDGLGASETGTGWRTLGAALDGLPDEAAALEDGWAGGVTTVPMTDEAAEGLA